MDALKHCHCRKMLSDPNKYQIKEPMLPSLPFPNAHQRCGNPVGNVIRHQQGAKAPAQKNPPAKALNPSGRAPKRKRTDSTARPATEDANAAAGWKARHTTLKEAR